MQKVWSKFETKAKDVGVSDWLPGFLEELRPVIGSEIKWTLQNLPDHYPAVVISLLQDFMQKLQPQIEQSIFQDLQQGGTFLKSYATVPCNLQAKRLSANSCKWTLSPELCCNENEAFIIVSDVNVIPYTSGAKAT